MNGLIPGEFQLISVNYNLFRLDDKKRELDKFTNETDEFSDLAIEKQFVSDCSFNFFFACLENPNSE